MEEKGRKPEWNTYAAEGQTAAAALKAGETQPSPPAALQAAIAAVTPSPVG